jgi:hypothetical protein
MKQTAIKLFVIIITTLILGGCSSNDTTDIPKGEALAIDEASLDDTEISITENATENNAILVEEQAKELIGKIKEVPFFQDKTIETSDRWSYSIQFQKDGTVVDSINILDETTLEYRGDVYVAKTSGIDMDYLRSHLYTTFEAVVIDASDNLLITPDEESSVYRSSDKLTVNLVGTTIKNNAGEEISKSDLKIGDVLKITFNGVILESYPAQITATEITVIDKNILIDGYMALIDDIYQEDNGLNSDITMIAIDTTEWEGLTDLEQVAILSLANEKYNVEIVKGTYEELAEQGLIDKDKLYFPEGVLIKISKVKIKKDSKRITCAIEKWRSGLGAIGSSDVTATYDGTEWKIKKENMWIS